MPKARHQKATRRGGFFVSTDRRSGFGLDRVAEMVAAVEIPSCGVCRRSLLHASHGSHANGACQVVMGRAQAVVVRSLSVTGELFGVNLQVDLVEVVDGWIALAGLDCASTAMAADNLEPTLNRSLEFRV